MNKLLKILSAAVFLTFLFFIPPQQVSANEGRFSLENGPVRCEGISIWQNGGYKISGICNGLVYPFHEQLNHYVFWINPDKGGDPVKISDIDRGIINGITPDRFSSMFVTAETSGAPRQPGSDRIISGNLTQFDFPLPYQGTVSSNQPAPEPTSPATAPESNVTPTPTPAANSTISLQPFTLPGNALPAILIGVIVVIVLALVSFFRH